MQAEEIPADKVEGLPHIQEAQLPAGLEASTTQIQVQEQPDLQESALPGAQNPAEQGIAAQWSHESALSNEKGPEQALADETMPGLQQAIPSSWPATNGTPALPPPAVKPLKVAKSGGMRAMLGRKAAKAISALIAPAPAPSKEKDISHLEQVPSHTYLSSSYHSLYFKIAL